jgi:hypothetical protein
VDEVKLKTVRLEQGMTDSQVLEVMGPPDTQEGTICGKLTSQGPWPCVIWGYRTDNPYMALRLTFVKATPLRLNDWQF